MQFVMTVVTVVAGLVFSLAIALLVEELIFGKVFRVFFAERAVARVRGDVHAGEILSRPRA
jgi:hypothetical protein